MSGDVCARGIVHGCWNTTRPGSGPKVSAFCTHYVNVGYCRLGDGTDPPYQRKGIEVRS